MPKLRVGLYEPCWETAQNTKGERKKGGKAAGYQPPHSPEMAGTLRYKRRRDGPWEPEARGPRPQRSPSQATAHRTGATMAALLYMRISSHAIPLALSLPVSSETNEFWRLWDSQDITPAARSTVGALWAQPVRRSDLPGHQEAGAYPKWWGTASPGTVYTPYTQRTNGKAELIQPDQPQRMDL